MKTMKTMKQMEHTAENICFVKPGALQNKFQGVLFGKNASYPFICFMFFSVVYTFYRWMAENMKIMKIYEARLSKGIYLPCVIGGVRPAPKHEANMKMYEGMAA